MKIKVSIKYKDGKETHETTDIRAISLGRMYFRLNGGTYIALDTIQELTIKPLPVVTVSHP